MGPGRSEEYLRRFRGLLKVVSAHHRPSLMLELEMRGISAAKSEFSETGTTVRPNFGRYRSNGGLPRLQRLKKCCCDCFESDCEEITMFGGF